MAPGGGGRVSVVVVMVVVVCSMVGGNALNITKMIAPKLADPRENMQLQCHFNMGVEDLYAVKWYKDDHEFFRYTPSQPPYVLKFPVPGVTVLSKESVCARGRCDLVLTGLTNRYTSGEYRCEVSSEAPAFRIASRTMNVTVAAVPKERPRLEDLQDTYEVGDYMTATCTSAPGDPKPHLSFFVNHQQVPSRYINPLPSTGHRLNTSAELRLEPSSIQVRLPLDRRHFNSTGTRVECVSLVPDLPPEAAPPLTAAKTVMVLDRSLVNNEKYRWPMRSSSPGETGAGAALVGLGVTVRWVCGW